MDSIIILAARNQLSNSNYNSQMTPIHGKPALFWVIDLYYKTQKSKEHGGVICLKK